MAIAKIQGVLAILGALAITGSSAALGQKAAAEPGLVYAFSVRIELLAPVELGTIDGARRRFIPISGGRITGPRLNGVVLAGGGDWQSIQPGGLTIIEARYFLKADDGTVIGITNPGVRTASPEVIDRLTRGEVVDPSAYYFRTSPRFDAPPGAHEWLRRKTFVARATRAPDHVDMDVYEVR